MIHDLIMPKMGESITEATILRWLFKTGDWVNLDQPVLEIATDKVDSEIQSPVTGILTEILFKENEVVPVGEVIAKISDQNQNTADSTDTTGLTDREPTLMDESSWSEEEIPDSEVPESVPFTPLSPIEVNKDSSIAIASSPDENLKGRFYSPLVRTIAREENITSEELESIPGTGSEGRVTKSDILKYVDTKQKVETNLPDRSGPSVINPPDQSRSASVPGESDIIEMDRMGRLIADHMVSSKRISPHVTSFIEVDVTRIVKWREKNKAGFQQKYQQNITYTPIFLNAVIQAIKAFPLINSSLNGYQISLKKDINIGMATALTNGNLIVPVIKKADLLNLQGLVAAVNDLANRARLNQLKPDEVMGGTFTVTNIGSFDSLMGTPIINQPQVAILAIGSIKKKPVVIETSYGDVLGIGHCMFMSLSYDHRIINGFLGGSFLKKIADLLQSHDPNTSF